MILANSGGGAIKSAIKQQYTHARAPQENSAPRQDMPFVFESERVHQHSRVGEREREWVNEREREREIDSRYESFFDSVVHFKPKRRGGRV